MNHDDIITASGQFQLQDIKPSYTMTFHRQGKVIGTLDFNGPKMTFSGEMEESARLFFDFVANAFPSRFAQERAKQREACAQLLESISNAPDMQAYAAAIRAQE